jgi:hypothetical protein
VASTVRNLSAKWEENRPRRLYGKTCLYLKSPVALAKRDRETDNLACRMYEIMPWLTKTDGPSARRWAQLEYLADMVFLELKNNGLLNADGEARRLLGEFRKLIGNQLQIANALGMPASARAALGIGQEKAAIPVGDIRAEIRAAINGDEGEGEEQ